MTRKQTNLQVRKSTVEKPDEGDGDGTRPVAVLEAASPLFENSLLTEIILNSLSSA